MGALPSGEPRLLDQVGQAMRLRHYSPRTEEAYLAWIRRFIVYHGKRHPGELGADEVTAGAPCRSRRGRRQSRPRA
jgi:hypothetical protein